MAKRGRKQQSDTALKQVKHRLLVHYNLGQRYRPPALLLIVMGLFALLPARIEELQSTDIDPDALVIFGSVVVLVGVCFWLFSTIAIYRSHVICRADLLAVRSPFYYTLVSYRRIKDVRAVPVKKIYEDRKLRGITKPLVKPLLGEMAVVVTMTSWSKSKRRLKRFHGHLLFSPRKEEDAWVFIVPNYNLLMREIEEYRTRKLDEDRQQAYEDPIERLKYYSRS